MSIAANVWWLALVGLVPLGSRAGDFVPDCVAGLRALVSSPGPATAGRARKQTWSVLESGDPSRPTELLQHASWQIHGKTAWTGCWFPLADQALDPRTHAAGSWWTSDGRVSQGFQRGWTTDGRPGRGHSGVIHASSGSCLQDWAQQERWLLPATSGYGATQPGSPTVLELLLQYPDGVTDDGSTSLFDSRCRLLTISGGPASWRLWVDEEHSLLVRYAQLLQTPPGICVTVRAMPRIELVGGRWYPLEISFETRVPVAVPALGDAWDQLPAGATVQIAGRPVTKVTDQVGWTVVARDHYEYSYETAAAPPQAWTWPANCRIMDYRTGREYELPEVARQ